MATGTIIITATGAGSNTLPADWTNTNTIEVIGAGAGGTSGYHGPGGTGGAYAKISNYGANPGSTYYYNVGLGGAGGSGSTDPGAIGANGSNTWVNFQAAAQPTSTSNGVSAAGGLATAASSQQNPPNAANSVGSIINLGGGYMAYVSSAGGAGGGGAGGPSGNGGWGGNTASARTAGGSGGGGGGGANGAAPTTANGATGGNNYLGVGGGAGGNASVNGGAGGPGSNGGGGGGGANSGANSWGGAGGKGVEWGTPIGSFGSGGGGGGGGDGTGGAALVGGAGGAYGGGGGGGDSNAPANGGIGANGIIRITYETLNTSGVVFAVPLPSSGYANVWSASGTIARYPLAGFAGSGVYGTIANGSVIVGMSWASTGTLTGNSYRYDPGLNAWSQIANTGIAGGVWGYMGTGIIANGSLFAFGGFNATFATVSSTYRYDPGANNWTSCAPMPTPMIMMGSASLSNGSILSVAGSSGAGSAAAANVVQRYDPGANAWTAVANYAYNACGLACARIGNGCILAITGAANTNPPAGSVFSNCYLYDPTANSWSRTASYPIAVYLVGAATMSNGSVLAFGGSAYYTADSTANAYRYDPGANTWTQVANYPITGNSNYSGAVAFQNGAILGIGGQRNDSGNQPQPNCYFYS